MPLLERTPSAEERPVPETPDAIRAAVARRFALVADDPERESKFPVGPASAKALGYDPQEIDALPPAVTESFCGVGNPLALGELRRGQTALDLGAAPRRPAPAGRRAAARRRHAGGGRPEGGVVGLFR
jgi:hypothetical protein